MRCRLAEALQTVCRLMHSFRVQLWAAKEPPEAVNVNLRACPRFHFESKVSMILLVIPEHGSDLSHNVRKPKSGFKGTDFCSSGRKEQETSEQLLLKCSSWMKVSDKEVFLVHRRGFFIIIIYVGSRLLNGTFLLPLLYLLSCCVGQQFMNPAEGKCLVFFWWEHKYFIISVTHWSFLTVDVPSPKNKA